MYIGTVVISGCIVYNNKLFCYAKHKIVKLNYNNQDRLSNLSIIRVEIVVNNEIILYNYDGNRRSYTIIFKFED